MMKTGKLFIISGPSGAGKGVISRKIAESDGVHLSVSMTTRPPRSGETEGVSYYFVSHDEFRAKIGDGGFFEFAEVYGEYYGTPKAPVEAHIAGGDDVILEIDIKGAMQAVKTAPDAATIFILPPSLAELRRRIEGRATDSKEAIEKRLAKAVSEIEFLTKYDYCVVNDELGEAVDRVRKVMAGELPKITPDEVASLVRKFEEEKEQE
jgi:guanylate kinase